MTLFVPESELRNELSVVHLTCLNLWTLMHIEKCDIGMLTFVQIPTPYPETDVRTGRVRGEGHSDFVGDVVR